VYTIQIARVNNEKNEDLGYDGTHLTGADSVSPAKEH
jgi:hypothetical protein